MLFIHFQFLSRYGAKEIAKHAGPIVAEVMNSWEYLLLRGEKLKSGDGTLLISLLKELKVILAQIQTISSHSLEPLTQKYQYSSNTLTVCFIFTFNKNSSIRGLTRRTYSR